jgi:DHA1 family bicyclomycin/chloramphenicol resistance-like MFS transporter
MSSRPVVHFLDRSTPPTVFTLVMLASIAALTMSIFLPSLPRMTEYFDTDYRLMQLSVAVYLGMNAVLQVIVGPLSDRFGRRPVILWGCGLFCAATVGCLMAQSVEVFLFFRMAQAVIVTAMVLSRAVVRDMVPANEAASMIGYVTMGMSLVPMIGPAIGGALEASFDWQASFWALLIAGLALWALAWADLGETAKNTSTSMAAQIRDYPELLTSPRFWGYSMGAAFTSGAFFAYLGGAPYVGDKIFEMTPATVGLFLGVPAVGYFVGNFISGRYSQRLGINTMVLRGSLISFSGLSLMALLFALGFENRFIFFGLMTAVGMGNGLVLPNATAGMLSVRPRLAGTASGLGGAMMIGGGAALSALAGTALGTGGSAMPLILIMLGSSFCGVLTMTATVRRDRRLADAAAAALPVDPPPGTAG